MRIDRRQFVADSAWAALAVGPITAAGASPKTALAREPSPPEAGIPILDTHQHLWDLDKFRLPWLKSAGKLNRSYLTKDYLEAVQGLNVVKTVYMEVAVEVSQQLAEAQHVVELCRRSDNPTAAAVIGGRPANDGFPRYIGRFKDSPCVKGVRQILDGPEPCRDKQFIRGIRLLGELGMSFDLCMPARQLAAGAELLDQCPHTRFILDHCGNADPKAFRPAANRQAAAEGVAPEHKPDQWQRDVDRLAKRKNIVCKISGIVARAPKGNWTPEDLAPIINHCLEAFGPERVMFGSDWPVCTRAATLVQWVRALKEVVGNRGKSENRKLLHDNAVAFYGLK